MTIHMSKHRLGEHDKSLVQAELNGHVSVIHQLLKEIDGKTRGLPSEMKVIEQAPSKTSLLPEQSKIPVRP
jgi:hypothetical protein